MKTIEQLKNENQLLIDNSRNQSEDEKKKLRRKIRTNNQIILALESGATEDSLIRDSDRLSQKIDKIMGSFDLWLKNTPENQIGKVPVKTYENSMGIPRLKQQLKFIEMILQS